MPLESLMLLYPPMTSWIFCTGQKHWQHFKLMLKFSSYGTGGLDEPFPWHQRGEGWWSSNEHQRAEKCPWKHSASLHSTELRFSKLLQDWFQPKVKICHRRWPNSPCYKWNTGYWEVKKCWSMPPEPPLSFPEASFVYHGQNNNLPLCSLTLIQIHSSIPVSMEVEITHIILPSSKHQ